MKKLVKIFLLTFLIVSITFTTIAYAGLSTRFSITSEAVFRAPADIRITSLTTGGLNGNSTNYAPKYTQNTVTMGFNIAANSTINYSVTVTNSGDIDQTIYDITTVSTNNAAVTCTTTGYNVTDVIGYRDSVTFGITCTSASSASNVNIVLRFNYKRVYHITYDANTGTNAPSEQLKYEDVNLTLTSDEPTKTGYVFLGWNESSSANTSQYAPGDTYTLNSDKVLYAVWRGGTHTVVFDYSTNGGTSVTESSAQVLTGENVAFPTATRSGYTFEGWSRTANSHEVLNSLTISGSDPATITLYAIFSKTLTGTFKYYNDQTSTVTTKMYNNETDADINAPSALGTPNNYTFNGWSTSNVANPNSKVNAGASITLSADATYYASYNYTVSATYVYYDTSSYTSIVNTATAHMNYVGTNAGATPAVPNVGTPSGWTNRGWTTGTSSDSTVVVPGDITANATYYYTYSKNVRVQKCVYNNSCSYTAYTPAYLSSYNNGTVKTASINLGTTDNVSVNSTTGTFRGWSTSNTANANIDVAKNAAAELSSDGTYYASYSYTVTATKYVYNNTSSTATGTAYMNYIGSKENASINLGTVSNTSFTESGTTYTLTARGWSTGDTADANLLASNTVNINTNTPYYASYSYSVTVTWGANSGSTPSKVTENGTAYMNYTGTKIGALIAMPAATTRNYYDFSGWNTNTAGTGTNYNASTSYRFGINTGLYAKWTGKSYTITLDPKLYDGTSSTVLVTPSTSGTTSITSVYNTSLSPSSISRPYTSTIAATNGTIYAITYNNIKYGFEGYYEGKTCTGTQRITAAGTYTNFTNTTYTSNTTLYACWKKINAGADLTASHVSYTCTVDNECASILGTTVQSALDALYDILGS